MKTEFDSQLLSNSCDDVNIEDIWLRITFCSQYMYLYAVYIPPKMTCETYQNVFEKIELSVVEMGLDRRFVFVGDFNIPGLMNIGKNNNLTQIENMYIQFINFLGMTQFNNILNNLNRILDLVISNCDIDLEKCDWCLVEEHADHPPLFFQIKLHSMSRKPTKTFNAQYNYKKADFLKFYYLLNQVDWTELTIEIDINIVTQKFYKILYGIIDQCVPLARQKSKIYPPWYTKEIILDIQKKDKSRKNYKKFNREYYLQTFVYLRSKIKRDVKAAHAQYIQRIEQNVQADSTEFWRFAKNMRSGSEGLPSSMTFEGGQIDGNFQIANKFADYFKSVYTTTKSSYNTEFSNNVMYTNQVLRIDSISDKDILDATRKMKPKKSVGPDKIPPYIFKACIHQLLQPLKIIFNLILKNKEYPTLWKKSKICPIFKSGKKSEINNYRPVAIICTPSKIFESILYKYIFSHISEVIDRDQHGFMPRRSTETNLTSFLHKINKSIDSNKQVDVIFTDFSKAFDRVDHGVLLRKLDAFGVSADLLKLSASYLEDRIMYIAVNGVESYEFVPHSGVPQGSNLGPLFFLCLINDLPSVLENSECELFADDFKFYRIIECLEDCRLLQGDINRAQGWADENKLSFNVKKCFKFTFTRKKNPITHEYRFNNIILTTKVEMKDLGVTLDTKISFETHISKITNRAYSMLGFIFRNGSNFMQIKTFETLYKTLVRSIIEYASFVWSPFYHKYIEELEKIQKKFLRFLYYKKYGTYIFDIPYKALLHEFRYETLESRRKKSALTFLFKIIHYKVDCSYLLGNISFNYNPYFTNRSDVFYLDRPRTNIGVNSPLYRMCNLANSVKKDLDIFQFNSTNSFKKHVRKLNI